MKLPPPTDQEVENHHGNQESLSSLSYPSSPGFIKGARGLMRSQSSPGYRKENDRGQGSWWVICERHRLWEMADCGTLEDQGPSV